MLCVVHLDLSKRGPLAGRDLEMADVRRRRRHDRFAGAGRALQPLLNVGRGRHEGCEDLAGEYTAFRGNGNFLGRRRE